MLRFRLIKNDFKPFMEGIARLATPTGRRTVQRAMATEFLKITKSTSSNSAARPKFWPPLSPAYAKRVGRSHATLKLTGALFDSIKIGQDRERFCEVATDMEYAWAQFFGFRPNNLPARPYFPVEFAGSAYRLIELADRKIWIEARRNIDRITRGALPMSKSKPFVRAQWESHPLTSPIT